MTFIEDIANVIRFGGCVVMGIGVAPEKYRSLLQGTTTQDYMVVGAKDSNDASFIASRISGDVPEPKAFTLLGLEMNAYFIRSEKVNN